MSGQTATNKLTKRKREALVLLASEGLPLSPSEFAYKFWPDTKWTRGNGPWGLGPDSAGRTGGRMLNALRKAGLVRFWYNSKHTAYTASITAAGHAAVDDE